VCAPRARLSRVVVGVAVGPESGSHAAQGNWLSRVVRHHGWMCHVVGGHR